MQVLSSRGRPHCSRVFPAGNNAEIKRPVILLASTRARPHGYPCVAVLPGWEITFDVYSSTVDKVLVKTHKPWTKPQRTQITLKIKGSLLFLHLFCGKKLYITYIPLVSFGRNVLTTRLSQKLKKNKTSSETLLIHLVTIPVHIVHWSNKLNQTRISPIPT